MRPSAALAQAASILVTSVWGIAAEPASASGLPLDFPIRAAVPVASANAVLLTPASGLVAVPPDSLAADLAAQRQLAGEVRVALGGGLADALLTQVQLEQSLRQDGAAQEALGAASQGNQRELSRIDADLASHDALIRATQQHIDTDRRQMVKLARTIYRQPDSLLARMFEAGSLGRALAEGVHLTGEAAGQSLRDALHADLTQLARIRREQQADRGRRQVVSIRQAACTEALQEFQRDQQRLGQELAGLIAGTRDELGQIDAQRPDLALRMAQQLHAEEAQLGAVGMAAAWQQATVGLRADPAGPPPPGPDHSMIYRFIWPLPEGVVTQPYGPTDLWLEPPLNGVAHFHTGVDIAEPLGSPVLAADDAVVAAVRSGDGGYGNYVVLDHGGSLTTLYGHLEQALVAPGDRVYQGQQIGLEGSTGSSTGPHCHFEVRVNGQPVDPAPYLPPGPPSPFRG